MDPTTAGTAGLQELGRLSRLETTARRADGALTPLRLYVPAAAHAPPPLLLLSHGAGGDATNFAYIARALCREGWLVVGVGHRESGLEQMRRHVAAQGLRAGLLALTTSPEAYRARLLDLGAALDLVTGHCAVGCRALLGHSMGAATVMIEAGAENRVGAAGGDRFDAYVAISPQGPGSLFPEHAWNSVHKPTLIVTGTRDSALEGDWRWRAGVFDRLRHPASWLAVVDGATHLSFAGVGWRFGVRRRTLAVVRAFLEAQRHGKQAMAPRLWRLTVRGR